MGKRDQHYTAELIALGERIELPSRPSREILEVFPNPAPVSDYVVRLDCSEFTSMCPVTGQPDYGRFEIEYAPDLVCLESKSLKLYLGSYRNTAAFWEELCNLIADDLRAVLEPHWLRVTGFMNTRGGIAIVCTAKREAL